MQSSIIRTNEQNNASKVRHIFVMNNNESGDNLNLSKSMTLSVGSGNAMLTVSELTVTT